MTSTCFNQSRLHWQITDVRSKCEPSKAIKITVVSDKKESAVDHGTETRLFRLRAKGFQRPAEIILKMYSLCSIRCDFRCSHGSWEDALNVDHQPRLAKAKGCATRICCLLFERSFLSDFKYTCINLVLLLNIQVCSNIRCFLVALSKIKAMVQMGILYCVLQGDCKLHANGICYTWHPGYLHGFLGWTLYITRTGLHSRMLNGHF